MYIHYMRDVRAVKHKNFHKYRLVSAGMYYTCKERAVRTMSELLVHVTLFLAFMVHNCRCECPLLFTPRSFPVDNQTNQTFQGLGYYMKTVSSVVDCGRDCSMDPQCASFNYYNSSRLCELKNTTKIYRLCASVERPESFHLDDRCRNRYDTSLLTAPYVKYTSCEGLLRAGYHCNGIYTIYPSGMAQGLQVYCDMENDGGGWTVFQRRQDGSVDFNRNWAKYQIGFGDLCGEFWLGNEALRILTESGQWQMRVNLGDWEGRTAWAEYGKFSTSGQKYTLHVGSYNISSTAGDSLSEHNSKYFSTWDMDNDIADGNCALIFKSAWWFNTCFSCNLNGEYLFHQPTSELQGIQWKSWNQRPNYSLKHSEMKIREFRQRQ
ncbi:ficolin-2-like [Acanthaster planci]|uniref:Ficolin-2-like n=1 Tax=Acanthaster planci TaxID=133434 RepID=A0A8B7YEX5_ACAPL|nr:ficolin-2-like [Acanthaster planci]